MAINSGNSVLNDRRFGDNERDVVFHGTEKRNVPSILKEGIKPRGGVLWSGQKTHVSIDPDEAAEYGGAGGTILHINANHPSLKRPAMAEYHKYFHHDLSQRTQYTVPRAIPPEAIKNVESDGRRLKQGPVNRFGGF